MKPSVLTRAMTKCGNARILMIDSSGIVDEAIRLHHLSPTAAAALGRTLTAASLIGVMLKDPADTATLTFDGDGVCGKLIATADYYGNVKGCAEHPQADLPLNSKGKLDVAHAVGAGNMYVIRDNGEGEPYCGMTPIVSGEIAEDITAYFAKSEQIPTVCALGVLVGRDYTCLGAGGVLIQLMPGADDDFVTRLEARVPYLDGISHAFSDERTNRERLAAILGDIEFDVFDELECAYRCDCSAERVERALVSLGRGELEKMIADGETIDVNCQFCDKTYHFTTDELKSLYERAK